MEKKEKVESDEEEITSEDLIYAQEHVNYDYTEAKKYLIGLFKEAGVEFDEKSENKFNDAIDVIIQKAMIEMIKTYGKIIKIDLPVPEE